MDDSQRRIIDPALRLLRALDGLSLKGVNSFELPVDIVRCRFELLTQDLEAILTGDEQFLILKNPKHLLGALEVSSGHIYGFAPRVSSRSLCAEICLQKASSNFTASSCHHVSKKRNIYSFIWQETSKTWTVTAIMQIFSKGIAKGLAAGAFDLERGFLFHSRIHEEKTHDVTYHDKTIHDETTHGKTTHDETIHNGTSHDGTTNEKTNDVKPQKELAFKPLVLEVQPPSKHSFRPIRKLTIGGKDGRSVLLAPHRDVTCPEKDWTGKENYFGLVGEYVVYYCAIEGALIVADFWPSW